MSIEWMIFIAVLAIVFKDFIVSAVLFIGGLILVGFCGVLIALEETYTKIKKRLMSQSKTRKKSVGQ